MRKILLVLISIFILVVSQFGCHKANPTFSKEYINCTINDIPIEFDQPFDTLYGLYSTSSARMVIVGSTLLPIPPNSEKLAYFEMGGTSSSSQFMILFSLRINNAYYSKQGGPSQVYMTEYGNVGEFIAGYFETQVKDNISGNIYPLSCHFRVKRKL